MSGCRGVGKALRRPEHPCRIEGLPPPLTPPPRAGKSSPPDGLGGGPRNAATRPKPLSVFASRSLSRVRFAGLRPPWTGPSTRAFCLGLCSYLSLRRGARRRDWRHLAQQTTENPSRSPPPTSRLPTEAAPSGRRPGITRRLAPPRRQTLHRRRLGCRAFWRVSAPTVRYAVTLTRSRNGQDQRATTSGIPASSSER